MRKTMMEILQCPLDAIPGPVQFFRGNTVKMGSGTVLSNVSLSDGLIWKGICETVGTQKGLLCYFRSDLVKRVL